MKDLITILSYWKAGKEPTEQQCKDTFTSFDHKSERIEQTRILGLNDTLEQKADKADVATSLLYLPDVQTKADLYTTYPNPNNGEASLVLDEGYIYQYRTDLGNWVKTPFTAFSEDVLRKENITPVKSLVIDPTVSFTDAQQKALRAIKDIQIFNGDLSVKYAIQVFVAENPSNSWRMWITKVDTNTVYNIPLNHDTIIAWTEYTNSAGVTFKILIDWTGLDGVILNGAVSDKMILSSNCYTDKYVSEDIFNNEVADINDNVNTVSGTLNKVIVSDIKEESYDTVSGLGTSRYGDNIYAWGFPIGARTNIKAIGLPNVPTATRVKIRIKVNNKNGTQLHSQETDISADNLWVTLSTPLVNENKSRLWFEIIGNDKLPVMRTGATAQIYTSENNYPSIIYSALPDAFDTEIIGSGSSNMDLKLLIVADYEENKIRNEALPDYVATSDDLYPLEQKDQINIFIDKRETITLDWTMYPDTRVADNGQLIPDSTSYNSTRFDVNPTKGILHSKGLTYIAVFDSKDNLIAFFNHNKAGELNKPVQDAIPANAAYIIASNYKPHTNPYASYYEDENSIPEYIFRTEKYGEVKFLTEENINDFIKDLTVSSNGGYIKYNIRIVLAGSSVTWGKGYLQDSMAEYLIVMLQKLRTYYVGIDKVEIVGSQTLLNTENDRLFFDKKAIRIEGINSTIDFDIEGDEISIVQGIDRTNMSASEIEIYIDGTLYDTVNNFNATPIGHEIKTFAAVNNQKEYPLERPFTYNHILKVNGIETPVALSKSSTAPTTGWVIARDIMTVNNEPIVQHTLFNMDGSAAGDNIVIEYDYGAELRYERTTIGKDDNGILENAYGRGYTAFDPANPPTSFSFGTGLDFRYTDERIVKKYTFHESKKRHVQLKIKGLDSRATGNSTPYFIFNFATSRMLYFMNAGIGGWKSSQFNDPNNANGNIMRTWKEIVEFRPTDIFYESTPNDDWTVGGYKVYTQNLNLSLSQLQQIRTMPNKKIEYNSGTDSYTYERWMGKIASIDKWSVQLSDDTLISNDPAEGDSVVIGTYYSDARQCIARLVRSYNTATKTIMFDRPINEHEHVYDSLLDFVGKEIQVRNLSGYTTPTLELLDKLKSYGNKPKIYLVPNPFPNQLSRDLRAYQPLLKDFVDKGYADGYVEIMNVYEWQFSQPRDVVKTIDASMLVSNPDGTKSVDISGYGRKVNYMNFQVLVNGTDVTNKDAAVYTGYCLGVDRSLSGSALNDTATRGKQSWDYHMPTLIFNKNAPAAGTITVKFSSVMWSADSCHMSTVYGPALYAISYGKFIE